MENDYSISMVNASIFQREQLVLANVTFQVEKGAFVYLVGRVGSGKSSLIKTFNAEIPLYMGSATVAGFNLENLKDKDVPLLRRKLGVVFQDFKLLTDRSVYQNLLFVLKATGWADQVAMNERIDQMLTEVSMLNVKQKMPHQLSGGEQQRIVIARALLNNPEIILADEPTGNLDPETSIEIMQLFRKIHAEGRTIVMATHDKLVIDRFPAQTYICAEGKVSELNEPIDYVNFRELM
ncbi:MAG TPA: ATP-binding cassette domain-containing protein [Prolixibacteraceae bacterium]|nr:ATP-binding cassette domain-containing protein [Prolixibacteraceae bacterium]HPR61794.1 ATP-binding cassette domain-containing protein [Prolixibacteraceae bacterium]